LSLKDLLSEAVSERELRNRIVRELSSKLQSCINCLRCTSGCTSMKLLELKPHFLVSMVRLGFVRELVSSGVAWTCALCLKCEERCPQRVPLSDLTMLLRNLSFQREENVPEAYLKAVSFVLETGFIQKPMEVVSRDFEEFTRESLGLPSMTGPKGVFYENLMELMAEGGLG